MTMMKPAGLALLAVFVAAAAAPALAKLPPPGDEAKAKAAEAAAKTAHNGKVDGYKLCLSMDRVSKTYYEQAKKAGTVVPPASPTAPCADPGLFVYVPPVPASGATPTAAAPTVAPAAPAVTAAPAAPKK